MGDMMGEFIDFAEIENQIYRLEMNRTFEFNLMLIGKKKSGKSTLVKSLFEGRIEPEEKDDLNEYSKLIEDNGVKLRVCCIESSEKADYLGYINRQMEKYSSDTRRKSPRNIRDTRVHCCLYLIPPDGGLRLRKKHLDRMKKLHEKVNLIPIISNADKFNHLDLMKFKENILLDLEKNQIKYFKFEHDEKEDEERARNVKAEASKFPFAIVAADNPILDNNSRWIRTTIVGQMDITDSSKCDFDALAKLIIRHCMIDLIDSTHVKHYRSELMRTRDSIY